MALWAEALLALTRISRRRVRFHHYQSLPRIINACVSVLLGIDWVFAFSLYLLLARDADRRVLRMRASRIRGGPKSSGW